MKKYINKFAPIIDFLIFIPIIISFPIYYLYTKMGNRRLPRSRQFLKKAGVFPIRSHYYQPLFDDSELKKPLNEVRYLPAIDLNFKNQMELLNNLNYSDELIKLDLEAPKLNELDFSFFNNNSFCAGDAEFLYQIIRYFKPNNIIEIGSGFSTKIANQALNKNFFENKIKVNHICIEPYEMKFLENLGVKVFRDLLQDIDQSIFQNLSKNDILFIDSSHIIRPQGDVLIEYLEIIPKLKKGVIVHVHDIFTPRDYPASWIREDVRFWNEQYLLEAVISNDKRYEILAALNFLHHKSFKDLKEICPYLKRDMEPGSFYFRIK